MSAACGSGLPEVMLCLPALRILVAGKLQASARSRSGAGQHRSDTPSGLGNYIEL